MRKIQILSGLGVVVMGAAILYGLIIGEFFREAGVLFAEPWFHVSIIDLYVGFLLFCGWILFRERSIGKAILWVVLVLTLGNFASCLYALWAALGAKGDWQVFWMGQRARTPRD